MILETKIDALDITILKGGGDEVGRWALDHGFFLTPDAPEVLDFYSERSPIFMAARFDATRARDLGQNAGDGTPIMLTIPTDEPWVPLRILGLGLEGSELVEADVFLLTDEQPQMLAGGAGLSIGRDEPASTSLLADLRSDVGMEWVPDAMWLTFLELDATASELDYDLALAAHEDALPSLEDAGVTASEARPSLAAGRRFRLVADRCRCGCGRPGRGGRRGRRAPPDSARGIGRVNRVLGAVIVGAALVATTGAGYAVATDPADAEPVLGPGLVTVHVEIDYSVFELDDLRVAPGTTVRFVVVNRDPIKHEFVVGDTSVHTRHEQGSEARHPPVPGEVSVDAEATGVTFYEFARPGVYRYACHLPGHVEYGMEGVITVIERR